MPDDLANRRVLAPVHGGRMLARAALQPETFNPDDNSVEVVWTTGADVQRSDWWTGNPWTERLLVTDESVDMSRLNAGAPVLNTHQSYDLGDVIGVVQRAWLDNGVGRAQLRFSTRDDVAPIVADIRAGIIRNISAGYWVDQWRITPAANGQQEVREATRWTPGELSIVPVPADAGAQVRALPQSTPPAMPVPQQEVRMADVEHPAGGLPAPVAAPVAAEDPTAMQARIRREEQERGAGILDAVRALGLPQQRASELIAAGTSLAAAQAQLIRELGQSPGGLAAGQVRPAATVLRDEKDTALRGMQDALLHRAGKLVGEDGRPVQALPDHARAYRGMSLIDMARRTIELGGGKTAGLSRAEVAQAALGNRGMMVRAAYGEHTTSDFPNLLANTASKALGMGYGSARRSFTMWGRQRTLPDFKSFRVINLQGAPALTAINNTGAEAGEITFGTIGEQAETYNLFRYGKQVAITFEAIVNDDLNAFDRIPQMFGVAAARLESTTVYTLLGANAAMSDGNPLFDTSHANVFGSGVTGFGAGDGVINVTGLNNGRKLMRKQTAANGDIIDVAPRWLLAPPDLEGPALEYTSQNYVASAPGNINPYAGTLQPIIEPRLTNATQWYLVADSAEVDTVEYGYLEGLEAPQITTYRDDDTDGVIVKCTHSFGAKATDWRGMVRSTGA